jgi:hypothetical protein
MRLLLILMLMFCASVHSSELQAETARPTAQIYVGWSGTGGDKDQEKLVKELLAHLGREFQGNANFDAPRDAGDWSANNAVTKLRSGPHPKYDHYLVAMMDSETQTPCDRSVKMTVVTFEIGRLAVDNSGNWSVDYINWASDSAATLFVGRPHCSGAVQFIKKNKKENDETPLDWEPQSNPLSILVPQLAIYLPEILRYDDSNPRYFYVSCLEDEHPWLVSDILSSKRPPQEMSADFIAEFMKDLKYHPHYEVSSDSWNYIKDQNIRVGDAKAIPAIEAMCADSTATLLDPDRKKAAIQLNAALSEGHGGHSHVVLQVHLIDNLLQRSFSNAKQPRRADQIDFQKLKDSGLANATAIVFRRCAGGLSEIYTDETTIERLAVKIRTLVDQSQRSTDWKSGCPDESPEAN